MLPLVDFHIHSKFSDGIFEVKDIARYAYENGFSAIGISDHFKTKKVRSLDIKDIRRYIEDIDSIDFPIKIYKGIEVDFSPRTDISLLKNEILDDIDYVIFEYVGDSSMNGYPLWRLLEIYEDLDKPVGLAHNNLQKNFSSVGRDEILDLFETHSIFVEINTNKNYSILGEYYYSISEDFFRLMKGREIPVSIGSDMHERLDDMLSVKKGLDFAETLGLQVNIEMFLRILNV